MPIDFDLEDIYESELDVCVDELDVHELDEEKSKYIERTLNAMSTSMKTALDLLGPVRDVVKTIKDEEDRRRCLRELGSAYMRLQAELLLMIMRES